MKAGIEFVQSLYMQWLQLPMQDIILVVLYIFLSWTLASRASFNDF